MSWLPVSTICCFLCSKAVFSVSARCIITRCVCAGSAVTAEWSPSCSHKTRCKPSPTAGLQWVGAEQDTVVAPVEGVRPTLWDLSESCKQGPCVCSEEVKTCLLYSPRAFPPGVIVIIPLITDFWQHSLLVHLFTPVLGLHAKKADFPPEITSSPATAEETLCSTNRHVFIAKKHLPVGRLAVYYTSNLLQIMCACFMSIYGARCH